MSVKCRPDVGVKFTLYVNVVWVVRVSEQVNTVVQFQIMNYRPWRLLYQVFDSHFILPTEGVEVIVSQFNHHRQSILESTPTVGPRHPGEGTLVNSRDVLTGNAPYFTFEGPVYSRFEHKLTSFIGISIGSIFLHFLPTC